MPRKRSKAFWNNFKFKYKLTIINENTLEEIVGLRVSKLNGLSVLLSVLAVLFLIVVEQEDGEELLIPAQEEFIVEINQEKKLITVELPEGLLNLEDLEED